ncbi:hypothetical protein PINS_up002839 [Pythium insidiosum]|nr:hypothetical protein PINS_up002839 [Pythium insidiosum]
MTAELRVVEEELKKLGISIVSSQQDTIISVKIKGLAGKTLIQGLQLCDQLLHEKIKCVLKACVDPATKLFSDPTFGPTADDPQGAKAICKTGLVAPSKGASQHQMKVLGLLKNEKLRWERPQYAEDDDSPHA